MSIRQHTAYNLLGAVLPMGLSLVTIPLYLGLVGDARYGVLAVAWLLLGYFGLFDLGLGRATAQRIASLDDAASEQMAPIFWTALAMNASLGIAGGLIIWPVSVYFFSHFFDVDAILRPELDVAIPWLTLAVPLATISGVFSGALQGRAKFLELNVISVLSSVLTQLLPLSVAWLYGPDLAWIIPAVVLARLVTILLLFYRCRIHVFHGSAPVISRIHAKGLLQFGGWVTVTSLVGPMMVILDRFVIGAVLGAKAVTYYTVPFQLAERSVILPLSLVSALFPRLASANPIEARQLAVMATRSLAVVMTPLIFTGILLVESFMRWWINPEFAAGAGLTAEILLLGFWINGFANVPYTQLQAAGRPDVVAKCHLGELIPYLLMLYVGPHFWGLPGAAVVFGLRTLADCVLLSWFAGNLRSGFLILKLPAILLFLGFAVARGIPFGSALWWSSGSSLLLLSLLWSWRNAPPDLQHFVTRSIRKLSVSKLEKVK